MATLSHADGVNGSRVQEEPALLARRVSKSFPGVLALDEFELEVPPGTVHALVGPNGCGKSTFVKILAGVHTPDGPAEAWVNGSPLELGSGAAAAELGVSFVHQDLGIVEELDAVENVAFGVGFARSRLGTIAWRRQRRRTKELLRAFGAVTGDISHDVPLRYATPVQRTAVAIVRALATSEPGRGVLVLDEPTAVLPKHEVDILYRLIDEVRQSGTSILLISHRLDEVVAVCDHVTVMRNGVVIGDGPIAEMDVARMTSLIAGSDLSDGEAAAPVPRSTRIGAPVLTVSGLVGGNLAGVDLEIAAGEILGIAGLLGSGREELPYAIAGATEQPVEGTWTIDGTSHQAMDLQRARRLGIALVPADRAHESAIADFSVGENLSVPSLPQLRSGSVLDRRKERKLTARWLERMDVRANAAGASISVLSGGNQQKVILGRWLATNPRLLALAEPTAGVDVGARQALYDLLREQAAEGLAVLMASSDVQDLLSSCDRVLILRDGRIVAELRDDTVTEVHVLSAMEGVSSAPESEELK
jgi:ABC-type sugar transport system ATPase subunit